MKDKEHKENFLKELENLPNISLACRKHNISRNTVYRWKNDEKFKEKLEKAMRIGEDGITDLAKAKNIELIKRGHWKAIERQLNKSSEEKETALSIHDKTILEHRNFLNRWRNGEFNNPPKNA
ncbi:MAG: hypothetical protein PHC42_00375 [Bacilli bacterium]|nr:hypothetical protein [Bacilli bacterium]